nr:MAG TPA: hypothetical protein [Caudoviricetes sp.]
MCPLGGHANARARRFWRGGVRPWLDASRPARRSPGR